MPQTPLAMMDDRVMILLMAHRYSFIIYLLYYFKLSHCSTPKRFCMSTMVPIPKRGSGSMGDIQNYRGIALGSIFQGMRLTVAHSPQTTGNFCGRLEAALLVAHGATGYYSTY